MVRRFDWAERLHAIIEANQKTIFSWGSFDCCLWACDVVKAMTGVDLAASFRGSYSDEKGARRIVKDSLMLLVGNIAREHNLPIIDPFKARRGDVVLCDQTGKGFETLGISIDGQAMAPYMVGLRRIPLRLAIAAWRIG